VKTPHRAYGMLAVRAERSLLTRKLLLPAQAFLHTEQTGGLVLLVAAILALAAANSPWAEAYQRLIHLHIEIDLGFLRLGEDLQHWVNDALMAIFFFLVGMEIKREIAGGELSQARRAALPAVAALGGMAVPALVYLAINLGGEGFRGWGIPMATDIAFALGILALLGNRIPSEARLFLLALAIVDDIGAILVIALFYTEQLSLTALGAAAGILALTLLLRRLGLRPILAYVALGAAFWLAVYESGVHATIAGVILGLLTPASAWLPRERFAEIAGELIGRVRRALEGGRGEEAEVVLGQLEELAQATESPIGRIERGLHPWVTFAIVPIFAFVNSGIALSRELLADALASPITAGIVLGLVAGKPTGIALFSLLGVRMGWMDLPPRVSWRMVVGLGLIAGIGFTVSLFISGLAFAEAGQMDRAKIGILAASLIAALAGSLYLLAVTPGSPSAAEAGGRRRPVRDRDG
jgi:NhaA family Na+:H+ antiporter